jgi:hypothetical protein
MTNEKGKCFNKERIKNLKEAWIQYNLGWDSSKDNIPKELYEIIEEIVFRLEGEKDDNKKTITKESN